MSWGWAAGQYPDILPGSATIEQTAATPAVLWAQILAFLLAGLIAVFIIGLQKIFRLQAAGFEQHFSQSGCQAQTEWGPKTSVSP